ncbi:unnamed protein product [Spirodela intermedia]|uniref:C3H1-type domain-containing protein n=1 Tax=Spirodela intermedia TaxID=51605 RepID=A0A7I8KJC6_SPIIN|nr:unnamed protein product [Spirodela intermedia]
MPKFYLSQPTAHHHHQQLHRRPDDGSLLYVSYTPSSGHLPDHSRFIPPVRFPSVSSSIMISGMPRGYIRTTAAPLAMCLSKTTSSGREKRPRWEEEFALGKGSFLGLIEDKEQRRIDSGASVTSSAGHSRSKMEMIRTSLTTESRNLDLNGNYIIKENHFTSRGHYDRFRWEEGVHSLPRRSPQQKPSILSRLQFGKPNWKRKRGHKMKSAASPLLDYQPSASSEFSQSRMDDSVELDVSFKSNVVLAKEIAATPLPSMPNLITGEALCTGRNVAWDASAFSGTATPRNLDGEAAATGTHKLKDVGNISANLNPEIKPNKQRRPKNNVKNRVSLSSSGTVKSLDKKLDSPRTSRNRVGNMTMSPSDVAQNSANLMGDKLASPQNVDVSKCNIQRNMEKEILVGKVKATGKPTPTICKNRSQGMTIAEKCPEEKMTAVTIINSSDAELTIGENVSGSRITMKKVKKGTLVTEKAASKKKVLEKILDTSVSVVECVEGENVMEISNGKAIDEFDPSRSVVKSDELISTSATSTLKKKVPKGNKKKKLAASVAPLVGVDQLNEICKGQASSHDSAKEIEPLKETGHESISSSHLKQNHLEDGKNNIKSSETTKVLSAPDSSSIILKNLEDSRVNVLSHSSDRKDSASVGLLDGKVMGRRDMEEDTLFPSLLDSHPTQQICEILSANSPFKDPVQSQELHWGSSSNSTSNGHNFMEVHDNTLRNEVYQESLEEAKVHSGPESASDCEDKGHLVGARNGSMQTPTHTDAMFQGKGQEVITLTSPLCGSTHPVLLKKAETSVAVRPSLMFSSQGTMALEHLEVTKATSPSNDVVPIRADIIKGTSKVNSAVGAVESRGSLDQCEDAGGEDNITCRESSESSIHLSDPCVISSPDTVYGRKVEELAMNFHDRENSLNASVATGEMEKMGTGVHVLPIQAQDRILDPSLLMVVNGCEANGLHLRIEDVVPQSTNSMAQQVHCSVDSITAGHVDEGVQPFALAASENGSPMREELCLKELGQAFCDPLDDINNHHGSTVEKMEEESMRRNDSLFDPKASESEARDRGNSDALFSEKTQPQPTREIEKHLSSSHCATGKERLTSRKVGQKPGMSKMYPRQTSQSARSFKKPPSNSTRHNTWHRTENLAVSIAPGKLKWPSGPSLPRQSPKKLTKIHSSYIRKGNSLIRKSPSVIPSSHSYFAQSALKQITGPEKSKNISIEDKVDSMDRLNIKSAGTMSSFLERPKTPPLPLNSKLAYPSLSCSRVLMEDPPCEPGTEELASSSAETQHFEVKEENRTNIVAANASILFEKETAQIKHSSSQLALAAGTDANSASVHTTEDPALSLRPLVFHYRRNRNKLIRDTSSSDSDAQKFHGSSKMASLKIGAKESCKTRLERVMAKTYKSSRFSLVWTLNGKQSENTGGSNLLKHRKVLPYLFPWKRTAYCGSVFAKGSYLDKHPSLLVRKLRLLRQKNAGYTISNNGFSLKMSGVRNIGGSSLKWSKSMEKRSRKTSEEVASAIVEHERKKRKQKGTAFTDAIVKKENSSQCKSAFADEQTPVAAKRQPVLGRKMSIVPRRLSIGNDEYVRVGNGNQLVRDPKKLVRILANEKIRWSLHTARLRSIRKQRYCQFFTRFGRCNKEEGKCPYIHDPTKVAICTKFLKGLCSSPNCKLTHKVIPERMPDCSYFLEGLCTNTNCPYRHVNVNSKASVCEGFLRGYCRDGDEKISVSHDFLHRNKASGAKNALSWSQKMEEREIQGLYKLFKRYVCPQFEVSGRCPWGPACKLHHPGWANKKASRLQKKKRAQTDNHTQGRYFGGVADEVDALRSLPLSVGSEAKGVGDIFFQGGRFADYISLDDNDDGDDDDNDGVPLGSLSVSKELYLRGPLSNDADVLIKPLLPAECKLRRECILLTFLFFGRKLINIIDMIGPPPLLSLSLSLTQKHTDCEINKLIYQSTSDIFLYQLVNCLHLDLIFYQGQWEWFSVYYH